jgi:sulfatase modifying factor 1
LLLKHAAETSARITSALVKGDWKTLLDLDPDNIDGLRLRVAAERAAAVAADKAAAEILARAPITNIIGMTLKEIPAGTFKMGAGLLVEIDTFKDVQHTVTISKAFYMQTTEVTQGQWNAVMGSEPWEGKDSVREGPIYPAVYVSRDDAVAFCEKLSEKESTTYRLPTEAEWEYACRAGTKTSGIGVNYEKEFGDYAWYDENSRDAFGEQTAHEVGLKMPNAFGLYDMLGNVYEWCHDYYGEDYYKQSPEMDPMGPSSGSSRVLRGGSYTSSVFSYTHRSFADNGRGSYLYDIGFRVVRELK